MPQITSLLATCQPWCTDHANGTPMDRTPEADDQLCRHSVTSPAFGEILVTHSATEGTNVLLYSTHDEMAPVEAEQFAYAVLAQIAAIRTAVAA